MSNLGNVGNMLAIKLKISFMHECIKSQDQMQWIIDNHQRFLNEIDSLSLSFIQLWIDVVMSHSFNFSHRTMTKNMNNQQTKLLNK